MTPVKYYCIFAAALTLGLLSPVVSQAKSLLEMSEEMDKQDRADFSAAMDRILSCTKARDFACAESSVAKAAKVANTSSDKTRLAQARQGIADERAKMQREEAARREAEERRREEAAERQREQEVLEERTALCQQYCPRADERQQCINGRSPYSCGSDDADDPPYTMAQAIEQGLADWQRNTQAMLDQQKTLERNIAAVQAEKRRQQAEQQERERQAARQAAEARNAQVASAQRAQADNAQRQRAEEERQRQERERQAQQAREDAERKARQEAERQERLAREQAAREAALREQQEKKAAEEQYLRDVANGTRLGVKNCFGEYHVGGALPKIKEVVSCIDVHYEYWCDGSMERNSGVLKNFTGFDVGCFGDTAQLPVKPACDAKQVNARATSANRCQ